MASDPQHENLISQLFRTEYSRLLAVLCSHFGFDRIAEAEDIVSDTFLKATEAWGLNGVPPNPQAWLYQVAKNRARDLFRRDQLFLEKVRPRIEMSGQNQVESVDLSEDHIRDSQLNMMFALCNPAISTESQIAMALRVLCGFGIEEIASAFLTSKATINKRLHRARKKLQATLPSGLLPELDPEQGLPVVLKTLYLLFNEGYYPAQAAESVRREICREALRLTLLLTTSEKTHRPEVDALIALMCFHCSRMEARMAERGELVLFEDQDRSKWDRALIQRGHVYLNRAATGDRLSSYHLEAAIAWWHTQPDSPEKWEEILQLYNLLLQVAYSPVAALNRTYALARVKGEALAIREAEKIKLEQHALYYALLAALHKELHPEKAAAYLQKGLKFAANDREKAYFQQALNSDI